MHLPHPSSITVFLASELVAFWRNKPVIAASLVSVALLGAAQYVGAAQFECQASDATIVADNSRDAALACAGINSALIFLKEQGLDVETEITIEIVDSISEDEGHDIAGHFDRSSRKAEILSHSKFAELSTWLRVPITESLYQSVAAHETAHIIATHNFSIPFPSIQAQEYIAYVTTMATLSPHLRAQIMSAYPGDGYDTDQQMNTTIYLCDPMRFGVEAYRHFLKKGKAMEYFAKIIAGKILMD